MRRSRCHRLLDNSQWRHQSCPLPSGRRRTGDHRDSVAPGMPPPKRSCNSRSTLRSLSGHMPAPGCSLPSRQPPRLLARGNLCSYCGNPRPAYTHRLPALERARRPALQKRPLAGRVKPKRLCSSKGLLRYLRGYQVRRRQRLRSSRSTPYAPGALGNPLWSAAAKISQGRSAVKARPAGATPSSGDMVKSCG